MGLSGSRRHAVTWLPQTVSPTSSLVAFAMPLGLCLVDVRFLVPIGTVTVLLGDLLLRRGARRAAIEAAVAAVALGIAGLLVATAELPTTSPDPAQVAALVAAAIIAHALMGRSLTVDSLATVGCAVAFAVLAVKAGDTGNVSWALLALVPLSAQALDTRALLARENALSIAQRLLGLPHLVATRRTAASDLMPFADDLRRILHADRLLLHMPLPGGAVWVEAAVERGVTRSERPPEGHEALRILGHQDSPGPIPRRALPTGWRAGLHVPLRASDGGDAGYLLVGWTRRNGAYWTTRMRWGLLGGALLSTARALGAFWTNVWAAYALERERSRLSAVIDHTDVGLVALDTLGRVVVWNAAMADMVGVSSERAIGERAAEIFTLAGEDGRAVPLVDGLHGSATLNTSTGRSLWVQVSASAESPAGSRLLSAVFVDRSAQRELDYMRHLLLSSVRHELYGPLTTISGHAQLLGSLPEGESADGSLEAILDAVEIMQHVTGDLIMIVGSNPTARPETAAGPIDVRPLMARTLRSIPAVAARAVIASTSDLTVYGDPVRLRQCLLAVLGNADKYAPQEKITITLRRKGSYGVIGIADEGPGIPPEERDLALKPYYRSAAVRGEPGSGMGLHIADVMMNAMHGRIELDEAPSGGLEVRLWLPLPDDAPPA